ncbi:MAG: restriction endonuclease subunit S, partial [Flavobacteriales bacterium]
MALFSVCSYPPKSLNEFIDYKTIGIGRVGARCGCVFEIIANSWVTDNALIIQSYDKRFSLDFLRHFLSYSDLGQYANNAMQPVISKTRINDVTIPLLDIEEQNTLSKILDSIEKNEKFESNAYDLLKSKIKIIDNWETLNEEIEIQNDLTAQLKQSILQEAIQGKLTIDWREQNPNTEPASELLKRIKTEKAELIKDKKIKKEKALPPITAEEIPFELPESWVWCRLGEIIINTDNLDIQKKLSPNEIINYVDIDAIDNKKQVIKEPKALPVRELSSRARRVLKKGQILYSLVRPYLHNLAIVEDEKPNYIGSTGFAVFDCLCVENKYVFWLLLSKYIEDIYLDYMDGFNSPSITHDQFKSTIIPVPPFAEQKAIVEKVETLMQKCNALEQEITQSEQHANRLMQAVLKEAFESKTEQETKVVKLNTKPTNIDYYKRTLLATEIVWQLHKEPTLGQLKLQKLMYLAQESGKMQLPTNFLQQVAGPYDPQMARS